MTPTVHDTVDVRYESNPEPARGFAIAGKEQRLRREILDENRHLAAENARLTDENHALREAASMWIRLYEKQLERANGATSACNKTAPAQE